MDFNIYSDLLRKEVVPAQGCTEPVAVAYAVSLAMEQIKGEASYINIYISPNIIKNALGVGIPGTGKLGLNIAAALGAAIKDSSKKLDLLNSFSEKQLEDANKILDNKIIKVFKEDSDDILYIKVICGNKEENSTVVIKHEHTNVILIKKNDEVLFEKETSCTDSEDENPLSIEGIYDFVNNVDLEELEFLYDSVKMNLNVSREGLKNKYGLEIGYRLIRESETNIFKNSLANKIIAATAAASDARMGGCTLTVMTTGGSGNQGIAASLPIIKVAEHLDKSKEALLRSLALSNLITLYIKQYIGRLSPLCGSGIAGGAGSAAAITYIQGGNLNQIKYAVNNMLADLTGMICDGAKESCALKIATATNAAMQCSLLALNDIRVKNTDGIVFEEADDTVRILKEFVQKGLENTDNTILKIMLSKNK